MKTRAIFYSLLIILLAACAAPATPSLVVKTPTRAASHTPVLTHTPSPTVRPTWTKRPPQPTRTPYLTRTSTPSPTATQPPTWGALGEPLWLENTSIRWSPTAHEVISIRYTGEGTNEIGVAALPDFQVKMIFSQDYFLPGAFITWSPDGEWLLFNGPQGDMENEYPEGGESSVLWVGHRTGGRLRQVLPDQYPARWLTVEGWMDSTTLATSQYLGGGHQAVEIVDFLKGEVLAGVEFHGPVFKPNARYVPAAEEYAYPYRLFAITRTRQPGSIKTGMMAEETHYARAYPCDDSPCSSWVIFKDWMPGADRMLVQLYTYDFDLEGFITSELRLWDLDTDRSQQAAAGGIDGRFSPDGRTLAFATYGPSRQDSSGKLSAVSVDVSPEQPPYLHLMDFASRQVFLSLPIESSFTYGYLTGVFDMELSFSPDSRFLAFYTPGAVQTDASGWPIDVVTESEETSYLNILDLQARKILVSTRRAGDTWHFMNSCWSPDRNTFVFQDGSANWILFNLQSGEYLPLTSSGGDQLFAPGWSFDGQYLTLNTFHGTEYGWPVWSSAAIWQVPQP
jgi:hypothetical protein